MNDDQQRLFFGSHYNGYDEPLVFRVFEGSINPLIDTYLDVNGNLPLQAWEIAADKRFCRYTPTKHTDKGGQGNP